MLQECCSLGVFQKMEKAKRRLKKNRALEKMVIFINLVFFLSFFLFNPLSFSPPP